MAHHRQCMRRSVENFLDIYQNTATSEINIFGILRCLVKFNGLGKMVSFLFFPLSCTLSVKPELCAIIKKKG